MMIPNSKDLGISEFFHDDGTWSSRIKEVGNFKLLTNKGGKNWVQVVMDRFLLS